MQHKLTRGALGLAVCGVTLLAVAAAGAGGSPARASAAAPKTLVSVRGRIGGFAQDGNRIAWLLPNARDCRDFVQLRNLRTRKQVRLAAKRGATCPPANGYVRGRLALAGDRALWAVYDEAWGNTEVTYSIYVVLGQPGSRDRVVFRLDDEESIDDGYAPDPDVQMAGDGSTLVFDTGENTRRVVGHKTVRAAPQGEALAVGAGKIAVARETFSGGCVCNNEPEWSPDGSKLAFSGDQEGTGTGIYVADASGGTVRRIADGFHPRWSTDGSRIVLQQYGPTAIRLLVVDSDGGNPRLLGEGQDADWSPDGTRLAFERSTAVFVTDADGTGQHVVAQGGRAPDWSPDGTNVAFTSSSGVEVVGADGSGRRVVAAGGAAPRWSPDGSRLLFETLNGLHVISADGTGDVQLTHPDEFTEADSGASWSPSGAQVVFARERDDLDGNFVGEEIWIVNADGSGARRLGPNFASNPTWSPDGQRITFAWNELYSIGTDGSGQKQITTTHPVPPKSEGALYSARSHAKLASFPVTGYVAAIAISPSVVALLTWGSSGKRIELFDPATGASEGGVDVDPETAMELSASGRKIVFRSGRQIMLLDAATKQISVVATAARDPLDLSIEGRRIAWAENLGRKARIRAVVLG